MIMDASRLNSLFMIKKKNNQCLFAVLFFTVMTLIPHFGFAATFIVNSTTDAVDANPGNGICASAGGICTLRAAIMEANALAGADIITLPSGTYTLTIAGTGEDAAVTGDFDITEDLAINGAGSAITIIDGNNLDRIFHIHSGAVTVSGVTIRGGNPGTGDDAGGGIRVSSTTAGPLTVANSTITENVAGNGGGIYNPGLSLTITSSFITGNFANVDDGGISSRGARLLKIQA